MRKIRMGVIGTGMAWERLHWPAMQQLSDRYEVVALCNRTKSDAENFARSIQLDLNNVYDDYRQMLKRDDIDAVDVMVPISQNYDVAAAVIQSNKNLIAEKPLAATLEGCKKLLELHREHDVKIMVAENYRYNEEINKIRDIINQGKIGEVVYFIQNNVVDFESEMKKNTFAAKEWRQHPNYKGGAFLDAALHDIAGMRHIFGAVDHVYAMGRPQQEDFNPYMSVNTQILFKNGVIGQYVYYPDGKEMQAPLVGLRIFGTKGEIYLEEKVCGFINVAYNDGGKELIQYTPKRGYYNELLNFYNAMIGIENISVTPEIEYGDVKMVFDILASIETKQPVKVDVTGPTNEIGHIVHSDIHTITPHQPYYLQ
ncbi:Gfo/Idh/MocA family oxidoreductase [Petroclostridium sp. X23]|uniref:Gfo/Idh/MocA family protein n=1 Tax=Petroclostridium sp. X23 TaxID=3045146 RepID=UPI0024AD532D|nr:Gfo/Idh/MocA family oxidoreductase [Petroclostridium sp. X23]WHH57441.1 Gfo/Idh/MocA family oxidoreductase [Petroclostridium sp. X23]